MGILLDDEFFSDSLVGNEEVMQRYKQLFVHGSKSTEQLRESKETADTTPKAHGILKESGQHFKSTTQSKASSATYSPSTNDDLDSSPSPGPIKNPKSRASNPTKVSKQAVEEDDEIQSDIDPKDKKGKQPVRGQGLKMSKTFASAPHEESDISSDGDSASTLGKTSKSYSKARVVVGRRLSSSSVAYSSPKGRTFSGSLARGEGKSTRSNRQSTHGESSSSGRNAGASKPSRSSSKRGISDSTAHGSNMPSSSAPEYGSFTNGPQSDLPRVRDGSLNTSNSRFDSDVRISQAETVSSRNHRTRSGARPEASFTGNSTMPPSMHPNRDFDIASSAYNSRRGGPGGQSSDSWSRFFSLGTFGEDYLELGEDAIFPPPRTAIPSSSRPHPNIDEGEPLYGDDLGYGYMHTSVQPNLNHGLRHGHSMAQPYAPSPAAGVSYHQPAHNAFNMAGAAGPSSWGDREPEEAFDGMYEEGDDDGLNYGSDFDPNHIPNHSANFGMNHGQNGAPDLGMNHGADFSGMSYDPNAIHHFDPSFEPDHNPNHGMNNGSNLNPNGGLDRGQGRGHNWGPNYGLNHGLGPSNDPQYGLGNDGDLGPTTPVRQTDNGDRGTFLHATGAATPLEAQNYAAANRAHNNGQGPRPQNDGDNPFTSSWAPAYTNERGEPVPYPWDTSSFDEWANRPGNRARSAPRDGRDILGNPQVAAPVNLEPAESAFGGPLGYPPPGLGHGHDQPPSFA